MIVVDAGHGGIDPGASGNGIVEKTYNLMISNYIYNRLKELGADVKSVRTKDETLSPEQRVNRIMNAFGNRLDVVVLSNHLNSGGGNGAEVVYALRNKDTLSKIILEELAKEGQNIRKWYQRRLPSDTSKDYYFIHRDTGVTEPVLIEYGFLDSSQDANLIKKNWRNLAEAVVRAVSIYKGIPYVGVSGANTYTVRKGDSLYSIAKKFNISVDALKKANNMTTNSVSIGQILRIPGFVSSKTANINYVVQKGDSLYSIASKYNITVNALKSENNLTSNELSIGQVLKIPSEEPAISEPSGNTYTVQKGDSLYSIASKFDTTASALKNINNLSSNLLSIGQVLILPITEEIVSEKTYVVQKGDSLYSIASKYNTTASALKNINNLTSNELSIGQILKLPSSSSTTYTVKNGDNLYDIARKYNTTTTEIKSLNNLTSNLLSVGQVLKIPS